MVIENSLYAYVCNVTLFNIYVSFVSFFILVVVVAVVASTTQHNVRAEHRICNEAVSMKLRKYRPNKRRAYSTISIQVLRYTGQLDFLPTDGSIRFSVSRTIGNYAHWFLRKVFSRNIYNICVVYHLYHLYIIFMYIIQIQSCEEGVEIH